MLRAAGGVLILIGSMLLRRELIRKIEDEIRAMLSLARSLRSLEDEVALTLLHMPKLLERSKDALFRNVLKNLKSGMSFADSWKRAMQKANIPQDLRERLSLLGEQLTGEEHSVRRALLVMAEILEKEAERKRTDLFEQRRNINVICISFGILLCILLL